MVRRALLPTILVGVACGGTSPSADAPPTDASSVAALRASCERRTSVSLPRGAERQGSAVALARSGRALRAYVADADSRAFHAFDPARDAPVGRTEIGGTPRELFVLDDGRVVATLSEGRRIAVLEPAAAATEPMTLLCEREVPAEPWGLARSPGGDALVETSAYAAVVTVLDASMTVTRTLAVDRDPRGVLVDDAGRAWVSHLVGARATVIDLAKPESSPRRVDLAA